MKLNLLAWLLFPIVCFSAELMPPYAQSPLDTQVISRNYYSLSYNESNEVANWVAYHLGHFHIRGCIPRSEAFRIDPLITSGSSSPQDYLKSGFDKGHLLPAGDMKFDKEAMRDSFYMSNMTPQPAKFNRGRWSVLENLMRAWALKYQEIWIVTGPILKSELSTIGNINRVSVPMEYFKVILRKEGETFSGIAFLMSVDVPYQDLSSYTLSIRQLEEYSGINFFPSLNDSEEDEIENEINLGNWDFQAKFNYLPCST
jgi:endonuclease G